MNAKNVKSAIEILKRAGRFDMLDWQTGEISESEADAKECGTAACFGGWIALSPEFHSEGGFPSEFGSPYIETKYGLLRGAAAIAYWLDISLSMSCKLCGIKDHFDFYHAELKDVTAEQVIEKLEELLNDYTCTFYFDD